MANTKPAETTRSRHTLFLAAGVALILAYAFISRALDTGSYWQYLGGLVFLVSTVKLFVRAFKK